ncbi:hypothetical protein ALQ52_102888 [Pseudomonas cannabina pv. alisalensis]|nr:hypothetical protein ALQ52_102888 [Pseudomonas cannabina pv. alisalensis]
MFTPAPRARVDARHRVQNEGNSMKGEKEADEGDIIKLDGCEMFDYNFALPYERAAARFQVLLNFFSQHRDI